MPQNNRATPLKKQNKENKGDGSIYYFHFLSRVALFFI